MAFTVTVTASGSPNNGIAVAPQVFTGCAGPGNVASGTSAAVSQAITPRATGSLIIGTLLGTVGTFTALAASTPFLQNVAGTLEYVQFKSTSTTTSGTAVTVGSSAGTGVSIAAAEMLAAGTPLVLDGSTPAASGIVAATTWTSASFTPPPGSWIVLPVSSNGAAGTVTMAVTDTSGLGLVWAEAVRQNTTGNGYSGVWMAQVPTASPYVMPQRGTNRRRNRRRRQTAVPPNPQAPFEGWGHPL